MSRVIYRVCDTDGNMVYEDTAQKLAKQLGVRPQYIYDNSSNGKLMLGKYRVKKTDKKETKTKVPPTNPDDPCEIVKTMLKIYGNTVTSHDPKNWDLGDNVTVIEKYEYPMKTVSKRGRKPKPKPYWYLEVVNAK